MKTRTTRRVGAILLLALLLPGCTDLVPTAPTLVPDGPAQTRHVKMTDREGRPHAVRLDTRGGYVTRVDHDVDGKPFARLVYHYQKEGNGTYSLSHITGTIVWKGRRVDVGAAWPQLKAAMEAHRIRPAALPAAGSALATDCYWELAELAAWSAGMAIILGMSPVLWAEFFLALAGYTHALKDYKNCMTAAGPF